MRGIVEWHERRGLLEQVQIKCSITKDASGIELLYRFGKGGALKRSLISTESNHPQYKPRKFAFSHMGKVVKGAQKIALGKNLVWKSTGRYDYLLGATNSPSFKAHTGLTIAYRSKPQ